MVLHNVYNLIWYIPEMRIAYNYMIPEPTIGQDVSQNETWGIFSSDSLEEIDAKVAELGLTDPDGVVSPH